MDRVAVVTGASAGVGRATAVEFARQGWDVAVIARGKAGVEATVREIESYGRRCLGIELDVADAAGVDQAADRIEAEIGPIHAWVNNAMVSVFSPVNEMRAEEYRRVTEVSYLGVVHGTLAALRVMRARDGGAIVQVGSALAYRSIPLQSAYCAAKHAIVGFTDLLRSELIHDRSGISLSVVHLPAVNTPQFDWVRNRLPDRGQPVPPIFQPEVAARAIVFVAQHPRRELLVGRSTYMAVWGQKLIPGLLDRYLASSAYGGQQTDRPARAGRPDNLMEPLDQGVDHGAHGRFDDISSDFSPALQLSMHRVAAAVAGAAVLGLGLFAVGRAIGGGRLG